MDKMLTLGILFPSPPGRKKVQQAIDEITSSLKIESLDATTSTSSFFEATKHAIARNNWIEPFDATLPHETRYVQLLFDACSAGRSLTVVNMGVRAFDPSSPFFNALDAIQLL